MNTYLLDTHILLWWLSDDKQLSKKIRDLIANPDNHVIISCISVWEIVIKKSLNKLDAPDNLKEILEDSNISILNMTVDHVLYLENLPLIHNDPFDRLLISQSIVEDLILITSDKFIPKYKIKYLNNTKTSQVL